MIMIKRLIYQNEIKKTPDKAPLVAARASLMLKIIENPKHHLQDILKVVKHNVALTALVLKVVNSAICYLLQPISSVEFKLFRISEFILRRFCVNNI